MLPSEMFGCALVNQMRVHIRKQACLYGSTGMFTSSLSRLSSSLIFFYQMWLPLWFTFERNITSDAILEKNAYSNVRVWRGGLGRTNMTGNWIHPESPNHYNCANSYDDGMWCKPFDLLQSNSKYCMLLPLLCSMTCVVF